MTDLAATDADGRCRTSSRRSAWPAWRASDAASAEGHPILAVTLPAVIGDPGEREAARAYLRPYLRTPTYHASWQLQGLSGGLGAARQRPPRRCHGGIGTVDVVRDRIAAMHEAGADHVAIIPVAADGTTEHQPTLEALARG